jgi:hypothetical protein
VGVRLGQLEGQLGPRRQVVDDEHDLVADGLDHPPAGKRHPVVGQHREAVDHVGQLVVVEGRRQGREPDQVGEADGHRRGAPRALPVAGPPGGHLELAPPHVVEEPGRAAQRLGLELEAALVVVGGGLDEPFHLRLGHPGRRRRQHAGDLQRHLGPHHLPLEHRGEGGHHLEVGLGERDLALLDVGEAERPPEALGQFPGQAGAGRHLVALVAGRPRQHEVLDGEEPQRPRRLGGGDLLLRHAPLPQGRPHRLAHRCTLLRMVPP